jgi:hypothetical protein
MADWPTAIYSAITSPQRPDCASASEASRLRRRDFSRRRLVVPENSIRWDSRGEAGLGFNYRLGANAIDPDIFTK